MMSTDLVNDNVSLFTTAAPLNATTATVCNHNDTNNTHCSGDSVTSHYVFGAVEVSIGVLLGVFIVCVIVGNSFVILSVILFREMRTLSNGIIVSLASADLLVAIIVLPISLQLEFSRGEWILGTAACDFWVTADVFFCTSSILNICVIAVDRYWLITRNVQYTHNTTFPRSRVIILMVTTAWVLSGAISSAPLMGWSTGMERADPKVCIISQDYAYTIFSTFGAFWFPLLIILLIYFKIFTIARARYRRRSKAHNVHPTQNNTPPPGGARPTRAAPNNNNGTVRALAAPPTPEIQDDLETTALCNGRTPGDGRGSISITPPQSPQIDRHELASRHDDADPAEEAAADLTESGVALPAREMRVRGSITHTGVRSLARVAAVTAMGKRFKRRPKQSEQSMTAYQRARQRTRNSARTLGLIIGGFILCWLPFFIMATIMPFCHTCSPPPTVGSVVLWLGYSNSLLNPAIYAIWDKSFRRSFRRLASCDIRWSNIL